MSAGARKPVDLDARIRAAEDLESSFCLEAGAGTGKTTILVERFLSIIRKGRADCRSIAAITFTEKAAAEMKMRVLGRIDELLSRVELTGDERFRLERAGEDLERAQISTIHSFASALLREYPLEAGVDPGFRQLDEVDASLFRDECFNDFLGQTGERHERVLRKLLPLGRPEACVDLLRSFAYRYYADRTERSLGGLFDTGPPGGAVQANPAPVDPASYRDYLVSSAGKLMEMASSSCVSPHDRGMEEIAAFFEETAGLGSLGGADLEARLISMSPPSARGSKSNWSPAEICAEQKKLCRGIKDAHEEYTMSYMDALREVLIEWSADFASFAVERKRRAGILDFDDLLIGARRLLGDPDALAALRARYSFILVDEFQDTDPLQAEIIMLLAGGGGAGLDPGPGRLFVVGDPKQSIYRFRGADVEIYEQVRERLAEQGMTLKITQNFRSVPEVTGWVNRVFSELVRRPDDGRYSPGYEPIQPMREGGAGAVVLLDLETETVKADEFRREEGMAVARYVADLVDSGRKVLDPVSREMREVRYGDIALIYRSTTGINHFEDPLREAGIPYLVEGGRLYFARQEVRDISNALWVIEDPFDSAALLAVLRSPLFGFSDEEIFLFTSAGGRLDYLDSRVPPGGRFEDFGEAFELLAALHAGRNSAGPVRTMKALMAGTGYHCLSKLRVHGDRRVLNIRKAMQTARLFEERLHSFRSFARWMMDQDLLGLAEGESPAMDEGENAVRMITIHKSKGLQFPVVILVNLVQRFRGADRMISRRGMTPAFNFRGRRTSDYDEAAAREKRMDMAETVRLLYVAATRAGDLLVIPRCPEGAGYYGMIKPFVEDGEAGEVPEGGTGSRGQAGGVSVVRLSDLPDLAVGRGPFRVVPEISAEDLSRSERARDRWIEERRALIEDSPPGLVTVAPSSLSAHRSAPPSGDLPQPGGLTDSGEGRAAAGGVDAVLLFGSAFHRMMELALSPRSLLDIESAARAAAGEEGDPGMIRELSRLGKETLTSAVIERARRADVLLTEVPFTIPVEGDEGEAPGVLDGRVDLIFGSGEAWTIVDFKTDYVDRNDVAARLEEYRPQGAAYAWALANLGMIPVERIVFLFVRAGIEMPIEVDGKFLAEGERLVRAAVAEGLPSPI